MKAETKIYSDFIKRNNICIGVVKPDYYNGNDIYFAFYLNEKLHNIPLRKEDNGKWTAGEGDQEQCLTKKSAVYFYCKNNFPNLK
jgi:hypothetical protein